MSTRAEKQQKKQRQKEFLEKKAYLQQLKTDEKKAKRAKSKNDEKE